MTRYWIESLTRNRQGRALHRFIAGMYLDQSGKIRPRTNALFALERKKREQRP